MPCKYTISGLCSILYIFTFALLPSLCYAAPGLVVERDNSNATLVSNTALPSHHWQLAKSQNDVENFLQQHNLTLVDAEPQEAAMMPSWPQALLQYLLINPIVNFHWRSSSYMDVNDVVISQSRTNLNIWRALQFQFLPFTFVAWIVSFSLAQMQQPTAGWISVMGWVVWFDIIECAKDKKPQITTAKMVALPLSFQWLASLVIIIQRWRSLGNIAYQITNLNGCIPSDGLDYLQRGARSPSFRILQTANFCIITFCASCRVRNIIQHRSQGRLKGFMTAATLAELIYEVVVASKGTPMVVSGNCLLVELNPSKGFLDSDINTRWKVLTSFMGF